MKFEIYQQPARTLLGGGQWRWRLVAANNEIIAQGESYTSKQSCLHALKLIRATTVLTPVVDAATGQPVILL